MQGDDKSAGCYGCGWAIGAGRIYSDGCGGDGNDGDVVMRRGSGYVCNDGDGFGCGGCRGGSDGDSEGQGNGSGGVDCSGCGYYVGGDGIGKACGSGRESGTGARFNWLTRESPVA